jgi:hypothetical protein
MQETQLANVLVSAARPSYPSFAYALSDWGDVEFRFDCETQEWIVADVKLGGI